MLVIINRKKVMASIEDKQIMKIPKENMETKTIVEVGVVSSEVQRTNLGAKLHLDKGMITKMKEATMIANIKTEV
jgi:hypothetical protein